MNALRQLFNRAVLKSATLKCAAVERPDGNTVFETFDARCRAMSHPRVLELGTQRSIASRSTLHHGWVPHARENLGSDLESGEDVDVVADARYLTRVTGEEQFDVIISCSMFEHPSARHLAVHEVMKALRIGGALFIQTHQTFLLPAYPHDYFRFSRDALTGLFGTQIGFKVIATDYEFPAIIRARRDPKIATEPSFLNVRLCGEKTGATPPNYVYESDVL